MTIYFVRCLFGQSTSDPTWQADVANFVTKFNGQILESARSNVVSIWDEPINSAHFYIFFLPILVGYMGLGQ